jgi:hypothetical protein
MHHPLPTTCVHAATESCTHPTLSSSLHTHYHPLPHYHLLLHDFHNLRSFNPTVICPRLRTFSSYPSRLHGPSPPVIPCHDSHDLRSFISVCSHCRPSRTPSSVVAEHDCTRHGRFGYSHCKQMRKRMKEINVDQTHRWGGRERCYSGIIRERERGGEERGKEIKVFTTPSTRATPAAFSALASPDFVAMIKIGTLSTPF